MSDPAGREAALLACEFCGTDGPTRLLWSNEERRKVRCCFDPSACLRRVFEQVADALDPTGIPEIVSTREVRNRVLAMQQAKATTAEGDDRV